MRRFNVWLVSLIILALFAGALAIAYAQYQATPAKPPATLTSTEPKDSLSKSQINIDFEAGNLDIGSLTATSPNFVESNGKMDVFRQGNNAVVTVSRKGTGWPFRDETRERWQVDFAQGVPLTISANLKMANTRLDLTQLQVSELGIDADLTNCTLRLPASGVTAASIKADLSTVEITIPEGLAAKLLVQGDLSPVNVDSRRFPLQNGYYVSSDYATAKNKVELQIVADLSVVEVK